MLPGQQPHPLLTCPRAGLSLHLPSGRRLPRAKRLSLVLTALLPGLLPALLGLAASPALASLDPPPFPEGLVESRLPGSLTPPPWQPAPDNPGPTQWQAVSQELELSSEYLTPRDRRPASELYGTPATSWKRSLPIIGLGMGFRALAQDDTLPIVQGSLRLLQTGNPVLSSISARSAMTLPTRSNCDFGPGCQSEYRLAGTLDFFQGGGMGLYLGGGAALNKDSLHNDYGMMVAGAELNMSKNITLTTQINWIFNKKADNTAQFGGFRWSDAETMFSINLRL